jgi:hypothetical protein
MTCDCECETERDTIRVSRKRSAFDVGSCNFCSRQINAHGTVPGSLVVEISGKGMSARICYPCLAELKRATK